MIIALISCSCSAAAHGSSGRSRRQPRPSYLTCCVNTVQKVDVAQRVDELLFLYTNIRLRHHLPREYNGDLLGDCSKLLRFRNIGVHTP